jgi:Zn-dependent protease
MSPLGTIDLNHALQMIVIVLIAIDIHELAHAVVADRLGDPTPRRMGEISLNPFTHMDQFGILLLLLTSLGSFAFTYGRTHVQPANLKFGPQRGNAIVAIVGPLSNLALAALVGVVLSAYSRGSLNLSTDQANFLALAIDLNIILFVINLIPLPPLDGFTVLGGFLTARQMYSLAPLQQWGPMVVLLLFVFNPGGILTNLITTANSQILPVICNGCFVT